jgi:maleate isomerase
MNESGGPIATRLRPIFRDLKTPQVGLLALATDHAIEREVRQVLGPEVSIHVSRAASENLYNVDTLVGIAAGLEQAASLLLPGTRLSVLAYGCTSGTIAYGEPRTLELLRRLRPGAEATTPISAALAAFAYLEARRIALLTPYPRAVHEVVAQFLLEQGLDLTASIYLDVDRDSDISDVSEETLSNAIAECARTDCDAVFVSCTSLNIVGKIDELEARTGKTIVSSNQALAWHMMRLIDHQRSAPTCGRLTRSISA